MKKTDLEWLHYWRGLQISQSYFIDCIRGCIGLDPLSAVAGETRGKKVKPL